MNTLFVNCCVRKQSRTYRLAQHFLQQLPGEITEVNPVKEKIHGLDEETLIIRDKALARQEPDHPVLKWAVQFAQADMIVIAAPYWDLSFPASLKTYIERVNCVGVTFAYDEAGRPYGMCQARKLVYITTAGGMIIDDAYGYGYLRALCDNFYKIPETVCFKAENLDMPNTDAEAVLRETENEIDAYLLTCKD